ncbi:alcohol dehydrogenase catalytic domain-containing protein [Puniceicoccales bacterium CK1056]|uniref:Alcohol dehydrogenase catalytic domain-containing protein n=1 Tax=Oceanipulchritudo coccoides TaxID=2706888 RepID=A0A6B2M443_9BACT|nr:zinc-binding dehydrogenase [Oceanipulchritudo coccoides]NDV62857.1 alcohol dehydrogenase catalytic domain-containing protein [Oceanipulchritudo coccoides]
MPLSSNKIEKIVHEVVSRSLSAEAKPFAESGRAAVLVAPEKLKLQEFPLRGIRSDEILVKVEACGICGTDIHCYKSDPFALAPVVLGHEGTGIVLEVGRDVKMDGVGKPVLPGDRIVTSIFETSENCLIAKYNPHKANLCDDLRVYGLLPDEPEYHFNGYFGEYLIIRPGSSFFVVNDMSTDLRVLIEPAAVVCHALERAKTCGVNLNFRSRVVVQGCGPIGLLMIAVLRTHGINNIIAIDGNNSRLSMAASLGADVQLNFKDFNGIDDLASKVYSLTKGIGAHFGFQATGFPEAFAGLFKCIRRGGGIVEVGHFVDGGNCTMNPHQDITRKEITVTGSWVYNSFEYPYAYHFLRRAEGIGLPVTDLITHRFPLDQIQTAFDVNLQQQGIKVVVEMD